MSDISINFDKGLEAIGEAIVNSEDLNNFRLNV